MISQIIPSSVDVHGSVAVLLRPNGDGSLSDARVLNGSSGSREDLGPLCLALHQPAGCQGSRVDPGIVPVGAGTRWFRRFVRVPVPVFGSARLWRPRPFERDRRSFGPAVAIFGRTGCLCGNPLWRERSPQGRRGKGRVILKRRHESPRFYHERGHFRRPGAQVPDLGARTLSRAFGRGQKPSAQSSKAAQLRTSGNGCFVAATSRGTGLMSDRGDGEFRAAGGPARHIPVLREEALQRAFPASRRCLPGRDLRRRRL